MNCKIQCKAHGLGLTAVTLMSCKKRWIMVTGYNEDLYRKPSISHGSWFKQRSLVTVTKVTNGTLKSQYVSCWIFTLEKAQAHAMVPNYKFNISQREKLGKFSSSVSTVHITHYPKSTHVDIDIDRYVLWPDRSPCIVLPAGCRIVFPGRTPEF